MKIILTVIEEKMWKKKMYKLKDKSTSFSLISKTNKIR